jgi:glycosyltransferase involved in cell wall biosynthesis
VLVIENVPFARDHRARKQATSLEHAGYRVTVITQADPANHEHVTAMVRLIEYPPPPRVRGAFGYVVEYAWSAVAWLLLAIRLVITQPFGTLQTGQPPDISPLLALPLRLFGVRHVIDQRDLSPELFAARFGRTGGFTPACLHLLERASWSAADRIICVNRSLLQAIVGRGRIDARKVVVVGNGPVLSKIETARRRPLLRSGRRTVCWIGVMGAQDRLDLALRAAADVRGRHARHDVRFVFIGDGECLEETRTLASSLGLDGGVEFTGWLDEAGAFAYLASADVGIDPNLQQEVSPVKAMEYLAFGVPLVAFDLPQTREVAGDAGVYVPPGDTRAFADAIVALLDDPDRCAGMRRRGLERVHTELSWDRQEPHYLALFGTPPAAP